MSAGALPVVDDAFDLLDAAEVAACGIDRLHRVIFWNESAEALLGWTSREALGKKCYDVFAGYDVFGNICCFRDCAVSVGSSRGETIAPFLMEIRRRDGVPLRLVTRTVAVPFPGASYRNLIHLFEPGDGAALNVLLARVLAVVARLSEEGAGEPAPVPRLPRREHEILMLLASGYRSINIAARLDLSHATVRNHIQHLLNRLGVHSQAEAVSIAFRRGLL